MAAKVTVWTPALREKLKDPPVPIWPSRLEVHTREVSDMTAFSKSEAEPLKLIESMVRWVDPLAGLVMETVGASGKLTDIVTVAVA